MMGLTATGSCLISCLKTNSAGLITEILAVSLEIIEDEDDDFFHLVSTLGFMSLKPSFLSFSKMLEEERKWEKLKILYFP